MKYKLEISPRAKKDLKKIDKYHQKLISNWIDMNLQNTENPRKHGKALTEDLSCLWCYRAGNYRIVCEIKDNELLVIAISGNRP
jgi:mRNA interferase RelE/StbE